MHSTAWNLHLRLLAVLLLSCLLSAQGEEEKSHSTSVAGMVNLLQVEAKLIENLSNYADELEKKLNTVRGFVEQMRVESDKGMLETEHYLSNPLNAFGLIRRMHEDWTHWQQYMEQPVGAQQLDYIKQQRENLPSGTDLEEAATAIGRIQTTYGLNVSDMVKGRLNGRQYNVSLNALDCYAMGKFNFDQLRFADATQWIYEAIEWLNHNPNFPQPLTIDRAEVLHVYAEAFIKLNRYTDALSVINTALTVARDNVKLWLRKSEIETLIRTEPDVKPKPVLSMVGSYEMGCRGKYRQQSQLHCVYNNTNSPFLRLAPLKMELLSLDPYMVLYHDVLSSTEISQMQSMAVSELKRATVFNHKEGRSRVVKTRTSKVAWFPDIYNELTERVNKRIEDMTRFDLFGSEMLQVMNYGLGGHYDKHYDYFNSSATDLTKVSGDRIATVLFYLNDVEQGGATVFPNIKKAVFPQKGSAVMWYNLLDNGEGNTQTLHAACPVIVGSKWVCNKWIRERLQVFRRPCLKK
ncbi:hypothetical protein KR222_001153 [Zaprionus bogoriensis]|nr:hypothetical protein KR222_001153 [Zaprionus bogoriensis]